MVAERSAHFLTYSGSVRSELIRRPMGDSKARRNVLIRRGRAKSDPRRSSWTLLWSYLHEHTPLSSSSTRARHRTRSYRSITAADWIASAISDSAEDKVFEADEPRNALQPNQANAHSRRVHNIYVERETENQLVSPMRISGQWRETGKDEVLGHWECPAYAPRPNHVQIFYP